MPTTRTRLIEELFQAAYELTPDERKRFLAEHCAGDSALRDDVESLLAHESEASGSFLAGSQQPTTAALLRPGQRVGRFEVVSMLGVGGMGAVYEALQDHPRRSVALKLIRGQGVDAELLQRFRHEADILATLHHPGIAQVYEAGTARLEASESREGPDRALVEQPFFAMELVRGRQLSDHVSRNKLDVPAKAELVARIGDAVQHAHQRGVIHRDLKPDNILVVDAGGGEVDIGQPKVLDFGIARVVGNRQRETRTRVGHLIGTIEYMSPEQVSGDPGAVGTQSDVYSLGVLLYELLVGRPPLELADVTLLESVRRICEEQPRSPRALEPSIPAELEAICLKALEKDEQERYASAGEFAADLRRFRLGEPVLARSHSTFYVIRKTLRRHRSVTTASAIVLSLLVAFTVVSRLQATRNRDLAAELAVELRAGDIERGRVMARSDNLVAAEELLWNRHLEAPDSRHSFWALWELYSTHRNLGSWPSPNGRTLSVAFHPDGTLFATAGDDHRVHVWDAIGRGPIGTIEVGEPIPCIDFSVDGLRLAISTSTGRVLIADFLTRKIVHARDAHEGRANVVRFTPDGAHLVSAGADGRILVWDAELQAASELSAHASSVEWLTFARDGTRLATGDDRGEIHVWDGLREPPVRSFLDAGERVMSLALSADGRMLASGGTDKLIRVRDLDASGAVVTLEAPNGSVRHLEFRSDSTLISGGWWWVLSWNLETGEREPILPAGLRSIDFREADGRVATGDEWRVRLWDQEPRNRLRLEEVSGRVVATVSSDGAVLVTGDEDGVLRTWSARTGDLLMSRAMGDGRIRSLALRHDDGALAVSFETRIVVVGLGDGSELLTLEDHLGKTVASVAFSPSGDRLAHTCDRGVVHVHDVSSGALLVEIAASNTEVLGVTFAPDGGLATTARDDHVRLWTAAGEPVAALVTPGGPWRPSFSDDGTRLAVTTWIQDILVFDVASLELEATLDGHRAVVWDTTFAPGDSSTLASASDDGTVRLWDVDEARCLATLDEFDGWDVFSVAFGPDDVLVAGGRRAAMIWDLTYYERHMAANLERQLERVGDAVSEPRRRRLRAWAAAVLERPWPRF